MTLLIVSYGSCEAEVLLSNKIASIQSINSKQQGRGHARECIKKIETISKNKKIKEIWFPTVLSVRLATLLQHMNYKFTNFGKHPKMPDAGDVLGYKKILGEKQE